MRITTNFKAKIAKAKDEGYVRVYSVAGGYYSTTYCDAWDISWLLKQPEGTSVKAPRAGAGRRWGGQMNTRHLEPTDIQYSVLNARYGDR